MRWWWLGGFDRVAVKCARPPRARPPAPLLYRHTCRLRVAISGGGLLLSEEYRTIRLQGRCFGAYLPCFSSKLSYVRCAGLPVSMHTKDGRGCAASVPRCSCCFLRCVRPCKPCLVASLAVSFRFFNLLYLINMRIGFLE